jgi:hypothetical protein
MDGGLSDEVTAHFQSLLAAKQNGMNAHNPEMIALSWLRQFSDGQRRRWLKDNGLL